MMDEAALVELYWQRDEAALTETTRRFGVYCNSIAYNILQNSEDAEEAVNDSYLRVWNSIPEDKPTLFRAYLGKLTRNIAINMYNRRTAAKRGGTGTALLLDELEECIPGAQTPERQVELGLLTESLDRFLASLPETERAVFLRRYWYCDSIGQISARTGYSESKVKSLLLRIRNRLRQQLEREGLYQ